MIKRKAIYTQSDVSMQRAVIGLTSVKGVNSKLQENYRLRNNAITSGMEPAKDRVKTGSFLTISQPPPILS